MNESHTRPLPPVPKPKYNPYRDPKEWLILGLILVFGAISVCVAIRYPGFVKELFSLGLSLVIGLVFLAPELAILLALIGAFSGKSEVVPKESEPDSESVGASHADAVVTGMILGFLLGIWFDGHHKHHD